MFKSKLSKYLLVLGMSGVGLALGIAGMAGAQTAATTTNTSATSAVTTTTQAVDTPEPGDVADATVPVTHKHAPLGGDGVVSGINGTTLVIGEESDEGGASYTVDASSATITVNGTASTLAGIKVGDKVFVQGVTTGTNVVATSVSVGHHGESGKEKAGETETDTAGDPAEAPGSTSQVGQQIDQ